MVVVTAALVLVIGLPLGWVLLRMVFRGHSSQSDLKSCQTHERTIGVALAAFANDNDGKYPATLSELAPVYFKVMPTCPASRSDTYSPTYQTNEYRTAYTFYCGGSNHTSALQGATNYPQYSSSQELLARPTPANHD